MIFATLTSRVGDKKIDVNILKVGTIYDRNPGSMLYLDNDEYIEVKESREEVSCMFYHTLYSVLEAFHKVGAAYK